MLIERRPAEADLTLVQACHRDRAAVLPARQHSEAVTFLEGNYPPRTRDGPEYDALTNAGSVVPDGVPGVGDVGCCSGAISSRNNLGGIGDDEILHGELPASTR